MGTAHNEKETVEADLTRAESKIVELENERNNLDRENRFTEADKEVILNVMITNNQATVGYENILGLMYQENWEGVLDFLEKHQYDVTELRALPENASYKEKQEAVEKVAKVHIYGEDGIVKKHEGGVIINGEIVEKQLGE